VRLLFPHLPVSDTQVGIKLFRREVIDAIADDLTIDRYGFDLEMLALARARGFTHFLEAPIRLDYFGGGTRPFTSELLHVGEWGGMAITAASRKPRMGSLPCSVEPLEAATR